MNNLLNFFLKHSKWLVFLVYAITSCYLLFHNNPYQEHVYLTSANYACSTVYNGISSVTSYFHLHDINEDLQSRNALLEMEVLNLRNQVNDYRLLVSDSTDVPKELQQYEFIVARAISNSITQPYNYITINRGSDDGITLDMGVVNQNGIVGKVDVVGKHSSRVISLLNPNLRLSCKMKGSDFFGSLVWDGKSPENAIVEELPRHVVFNIGDTIVTSGFSSVFPEGIIVGTIINSNKDLDENFITLNVKLSTDFSQLSTVRAIKNNYKEELNNTLRTDSIAKGKSGKEKEKGKEQQ